jgi:hypothetical protein
MTPTDQHTESLGTPNGGQPRTRSVSVRTVLGSAVAVATVAGAGVLGVLTLAAGDQSEATGRPLAAEQDDSRATQRSVPNGGPAALLPGSGGGLEDERFAKCVNAETRSRVDSSSDDGLTNAWEAGSIAAKCHLASYGEYTSGSGRLTLLP